jgi:hypothetical protein
MEAIVVLSLLTEGQGGTHQPGNADKTVMGPLARLL